MTERSKLTDRMFATTLEVKPLSHYLKPQKTIKKKIVITSTKKQSEDRVVSSCKRYLEKQGWKTFTLFTGGIPIGFGKYATNPSKGIPDSINFHLEKKKLIWIEYKKTHGGVVSPEQITWHNLIRTCGGTILVVNSLASLKEQLCNLQMISLPSLKDKKTLEL